MGNHIMSKMKHNKEIEKIKNNSKSKSKENKSSNKILPRLSFGNSDLISNKSDNKSEKEEKGKTNKNTLPKGNLIFGNLKI